MVWFLTKLVILCRSSNPLHRVHIRVAFAQPVTHAQMLINSLGLNRRAVRAAPVIRGFVPLTLQSPNKGLSADDRHRASVNINTGGC